MSVIPAGAATPPTLYRPLSLNVEVAGVRGSLNQQKQDGQAALALIASAAVPIPPSTGQTIDFYA